MKITQELTADTKPYLDIYRHQESVFSKKGVSAIELAKELGVDLKDMLNAMDEDIPTWNPMWRKRYLDENGNIIDEDGDPEPRGEPNSLSRK